MSKRRELQRQINEPGEIQFAIRWLQAMTEKGLESGAVLWTIGRPRRNLDQNAKFHPMISDIRKQVFPQYSEKSVKAVLVSQFADEKERMGEPLRHPGEVVLDWKLKRDVYVRPSTTDFTKAEASEFIEFLYAEGAGLDVEWSERSQATISENRRAA